MTLPVMIYQDQKIAELMEANARLRAELAALREPAGEALVEAISFVIRPEVESFVDADALSRAVLDAVLPRVRAEADGMREVLRSIAAQRLIAEMSGEDYRHGDFESAYEEMVECARAALPPAPDAAP